MQQRGFTLIEVLVVIFIISIVTSVAVLTIGHNKRKQVETFANQLTQLVAFAEEQAVIKSTVLGLSFDQNSLQFSKLDIAQAGDKQKWKPLTDKILGKRYVPDDLSVSMNASIDDEKKATPQIVISANGDVTPFSIYVGPKGQAPLYVISGDTDGNVTTKELS